MISYDFVLCCILLVYILLISIDCQELQPLCSERIDKSVVYPSWCPSLNPYSSSFKPLSENSYPSNLFSVKCNSTSNSTDTECTGMGHQLIDLFIHNLYCLAINIVDTIEFNYSGRDTRYNVLGLVSGKIVLSDFNSVSNIMNSNQ
jgi:hypothetical protein